MSVPSTRPPDLSEAAIDPNTFVVAHSAPGSTPAVPTRTPASARSLTVAYLLWLVLLLGGHRYYLGRYGTALVMTPTMGRFGVWWVIDALLIPELQK
ncbi:MAG: TM2 domain-containing protein [Thermomicrobiales bacterium]